MFEISSDLSNINFASNELFKRISYLNLPADLLQDIRLAFEEALINAMKHGNKFNKALKVECSVDIKGNTIIISVKDQGEGYNYKQVPNPTVTKNLERCCGRGVFLIRQLMDKVNFNEKGNEIFMEKEWRK